MGIIRAAIDAQVAGGDDLGGGLVEGGAIRGDDVAPVVNDYMAGEGIDIPPLRSLETLRLGLDFDRNAMGNGGNDVGDGDGALRLGRVWQRLWSGLRLPGLAGGARRSCGGRRGKLLRYCLGPKLRMT